MMTIAARRFVWCLGMAVCAFHVAFAPVLHAGTLSLEEGSVILNPALELLVDPTGLLEIEDVSTSPISGTFRKYGREEIPGAITGTVYWLRFTLRNDTTQSDWALIDTNPYDQKIDLFTKNSAEEGQPLWHRSTSGRLIPSSERDIHGRYYALPLPITRGSEETFYVRIESQYTMARPFIVQDLRSYLVEDSHEQLILGAYYGIILVLTLYNLFLYFALRDTGYLYYVADFLSANTVWFVLNGSGQAYLWLFGSSWIVSTFCSPIAVTVLGTATWIFRTRFLQIVLDTRTRSVRLHKTLTATGLYFAVVTGLAFTGSALASLAWLIGCVVIMPLHLIIITRVWRAGFRPAGYLWLSMVISTFAFTLYIFFALTNTWSGLSYYGIQVGNVIGAVLFSLGLADRIGLLRQEMERQELSAREAERRSREARDQSERKSAFLASMAHELRTPLNAIKGFNGLVLRRSRDVLPDRQQENLRKVDRASDHLLATINDLLDLSKIEAGRMDVNATTFDVRQTILSACEVVSPLVQDSVDLRHDISENIGEAHTDQQRLSQMLINLLSNAIKFTERGSVAVEVSSLRAERLAQSANGEQLVISVSDTGRGIPEQDLPTLFDEYQQIDGQSESVVQRGTGLGLSITKRFAELLGGEITVESQVGQGSTFTVRIPAQYSSVEEETP